MHMLFSETFQLYVETGRNFSRIAVHAGVLYATSQLHAASSVYSLELVC